MGNSGSASLYADEGSNKTAKSSFRSIVFKHRRSFRSGVTKPEAVVNVGVAEARPLVPVDGPVQPGGSATATGPVDIVAPPALTGELAVPGGGSAAMPSTSLEPTYEEIRQGSLSTSYGEAVHHYVLPSAAGGSVATVPAVASGHGRSASSGEGASGTSVAAAAGHDVLPSDKAAHSAVTGTGSRSLLAKLALSSGKKSKKGKRHSKVEASDLAPSRGGQGDATGSAEAKRGSRGKTSGDKENLMAVPAAGAAAAAAGVVSGGGHRRAASYDRQLPDIPRARVSSDETIPKTRYGADMSPKQRPVRALPDIPHGPPPACDDPCDDQIYSAVTGPAAQEALESGDTEPSDSFYDTLQRDENPASVKIRQLKLGNGDIGEDQYSKAVETPLGTDAVTSTVQTYLAAHKQPVQQAVKSGVVATDDGCYDMLQRDSNPASVKTKQLKLQHAAGSGGSAEDQYSTAVELPLVSAAVAETSVESECAYYEALVEPPALGSQGALSAPVLLTQTPASQQRSQVGTSAGVLRRARAGGAPPGAYEQVELETMLTSFKASSGTEFDTIAKMSSQGTTRPMSWNAGSAGGQHGVAPYSAIKHVSSSLRVRNPGAPVPASSSDVEPLVPPPVPDKLFGISDDLTACLALPAALSTAPSSVSTAPSSAVPLVVAGQADGSSFSVSAGALADDADENEVYSEPIETEATAGAMYAPHGDLPANYDILTVRPPLSALKERLALADSQATEEENDYYETVDKADLPLHEAAALKPVGGNHSNSCSPDVPKVVENDAGDLYASPHEVGSVPPPKQVRPKPKSEYEEIVLPDVAAMVASEPTSHGSLRPVACNETAVEARLRPDAAGQAGTAVTTTVQNDSTGPRHAKSPRRCGYELVDLPGTVGSNPNVLIGGTAGQTVAVNGTRGGMVIPPAPADRPLALPLAARTRLPHHYDDIDDRLSDQASRPMPAAQPARHQHHHYDEIDEVRKDEA